MISLTRDGQTFGHRLHTRAGDAAPGFMCCKFDEMLDEELQPLWVAVLLWKDVQIRLTVIRPTFPVMAYEAPGSLGCEKRFSIIRRSDPRAGWEYAEADGRAIAIQRLIGYDSQIASAPFLDQSTINLAYPYSEQPVICESQASVAARCLASASLARPSPFEPADEFRGIEVEVESPEVFRVSLPDGGMACIAPGETTPNWITMNGVDLEGARLRYARMTIDLSEICGLGVTHIARVARFSGPAAFRLRRASNGTVLVTTNTGVELTDHWLQGQARCIEVQSPGNQWVDVSARCPNGVISLQVVQEWSDRNQRTFVEFRINT
jgi:hypothetical protein